MEKLIDLLEEEVGKWLNNVLKFLYEEIPWVIPSIISVLGAIAGEQWIPDNMKKFARSAPFAILLVSVLFRYYQKKHGKSESRGSSRKKISVKVLALALAVVIPCLSYFSKISKDPQQDDVFGWDEIKNAKPGDTIYFGEYRQSSWTDDKQKIEWCVLEKENDRLLILSKRCLDCKQYNESGEACTWETSSIRKWLNEEFIMESFDRQEQAKIATTHIEADGNPYFDSAYTGSNTDDKIFLLSIKELTSYFRTAEERKAFPTEYALSNGAGYDHDIDGGPCWWWLRTPGEHNGCAADVRSGGAINYEGYDVFSSNFSVRPALWLDLM